MTRPFIPTWQTARVDIGHTLYGLYYEHQLYFTDYTAPWDILKLTNLAGNIGSWYISAIMPFLARDVSLLRVTAVDVSYEGGVYNTVPYSSFIGGYDDFSLPIHSAWYMPFGLIRMTDWPFFHLVVSGIPQSVVTGNYIDLSWRNSYRSAWITLLDYPAVGPYDWVNVSYRKDKQWRDEGYTFGVATITNGDGFISQRRGRLHNLIV